MRESRLSLAILAHVPVEQCIHQSFSNLIVPPSAFPEYLMTHSFRRRLTTDASLARDFSYVIIVGASVGVLAVFLIFGGLYFYCKERKRNNELTLESYVNLASNPPASQSSPGIATAANQSVPSNSFKLQFYAMTSPTNCSELPSVILKPTVAQSSFYRVDQQSTSNGQSYAYTADLDSFDSSTRSRINSFEYHKSFRRGVGYGDIMSMNIWPSAGYGDLWEDSAIVAARIPMDKITICEVLSRGGFGEVLRGTYKERDVAIKRLLPETRKELSKIEEFLAEVKLQAALEHERVVRFVGVAWDSPMDLCVVSEFMNGGDLRALLLKFDKVDHRPTGFDAEKSRIALDVAHALTYLHCLNPVVLHRDLKSKNILLDVGWRAKLTDFGVSRERSDHTMTAGVGTSLWMAPEVMMGERYDEKADVFSFGIVLSELDSQKLPYASAKVTDTGRVIPDAAILQLVSSGSLSVTFTPPASPVLEAMVLLGTACVAFEPDDRPTASQALYQMQLIMRAFAQEEAEESYVF